MKDKYFLDYIFIVIFVIILVLTLSYNPEKFGVYADESTHFLQSASIAFSILAVLFGIFIFSSLLHL
jgi:hypothetical protein